MQLKLLQQLRFRECTSFYCSKLRKGSSSSCYNESASTLEKLSILQVRNEDTLHLCDCRISGQSL